VVIKHYLPQDDEAVQKAMLDMTTDHLVQEQTEVIELPKKRTL
jgi:hypothetical protein